MYAETLLAKISVITSCVDLFPFTSGTGVFSLPV
jgi:hypothetical protein